MKKKKTKRLTPFDEAAREEAKALIYDECDSMREWALEHGFDPSMVYDITGGGKKFACSRGKSRKFAIMVGLIKRSKK